MAVSAALRRWLLAPDADPSVRFRALTELFGRPSTDPDVRSARAQIGRAGWAARILHEQHAAGQWDTEGTSSRDLYVPKYVAQNWRLLVLADLGVPGGHPRVRRAVALFLRRFGGPKGSLGGRGSEVCFTGNSARMLLQFGRGEDPSVVASLDWLVRHQKPDGGWHCFPSARGTLDAWEALGAFALVPPDRRPRRMERAIERGAEFYLRRGLLREGRGTYAPWLRLHYPRHYYYDLLVGLDLLSALGYGDDRRLRDAWRRLEERRNSDGSWNLDRWHPDSEDPSYYPRAPFYAFGLEPAGRPSRWITTTALVALARAGRG